MTLQVREHVDMTRNTFRSIINSGIWTPLIIPTCTRRSLSSEPFVPAYNSLCFAIRYKTRGETFIGIPVINTLITIPSYPRYRFCSLYSYPYSGIPVISITCVWPDDDDTVIPSGPGVYLSIVGGANPSLELSIPRHTFPIYP